MRKLIVIAMSLLVILSSLQASEVARSREQSLSSRQIKEYPIKTEAKGNRLTLINESFEGTFPPANWTIVDADGDFYNWFQGVAPANPTHTGAGCAVSQSYVFIEEIVLHPDNWMITPAISIDADALSATVNWWDAAQDPNYPADKYGLFVSTTNTEPASFTQLQVHTLSTIDWTERTQDLGVYKGQTIYLAWRHFESSDVFEMKIDDVVVNVTGGTDLLAPTVVSIDGANAAVGNPINLNVVVSDDTGIASVVGHYQLNGQTTWTDFPMTASRITGTYTATLPAQADPINGIVKFTMTDTVNPANSGDSPESNISWTIPINYLVNEPFDSVIAPALPTGWTVEDVNADTETWKTATGGQSAPNALRIAYNAEAAMDDWVYTPAFTPEANKAYQLKFSYKAQNATFPEKFEIKYGTAAAAASMTNVISVPIDVDSTTYVTKSVVFTPTAATPIHIGFHGISEANMYALYLDDIKVYLDPVDIAFPVAATPTGISATPGNAMIVQTVVTDQTGIASVVGKYKLDGQTTWTEFAMTASKATGTYTGTIPAQANVINGLVKFTCTDTVTPANTGDSPVFDISWSNSSIGMWVGNTDAINTSGLGLGESAPWKLGVALDFGATTKKITKIAYMCNSGSDGAFNWSVLDMTDATTWSADVLAPGGVLVNTPVIGTEWNVVDVNNATSLTGTVGLAIDLVAGGFFGRHAEGTNGKSYIYYEDAWTRLGEGVVADFPGDWTLKCWVVPDSVGIDQESEMLPGKSELSQNYPNPFNPSTSINFYNNMTGNVKLTVINAKGETVATLINNNVVAGNHKVNFNGARFNSGVYFYKLETPTVSITKKMLLVK